tara:strand:+ start:333 stop:530 length:198 start_codon:yes stop_codon:yes gene_type:complete
MKEKIMKNEDKLLRRVTVEYYEYIDGGEENTPETIRVIKKKTKTENFSTGSSKGDPIVTYISEIF